MSSLKKMPMPDKTSTSAINPSCFHNCLDCKWKFRSNNKTASAVPCHPPSSSPSDLVFSSPLWAAARAAVWTGQMQSSQTWWESTLHLMKQLPGGQTNYPRLMIRFNYMDKIKDRTFTGVLKGWGYKLQQQLQQKKHLHQSGLLTSAVPHKLSQNYVWAWKY